MLHPWLKSHGFTHRDTMKLLQILKRSQPIFLDSSCFIYTYEHHKEFGELCAQVFNEVSEGKIQSFTSIETVSEVLVKPFRENNTQQVELYMQLFEKMPNLTLVSPQYNTATKASKIVAKYNFQMIDSFQLAIAIENNCKVFLTNDKQLAKCKEIKVICVADFVNKK